MGGGGNYSPEVRVGGGGSYSPEGRGGGGGNPPFGKDFTNFVEKDLYNSARRLQ